MCDIWNIKTKKFAYIHISKTKIYEIIIAIPILTAKMAYFGFRM
jgi:hypothetical protein